MRTRAGAVVALLALAACSSGAGIEALGGEGGADAGAEAAADAGDELAAEEAGEAEADAAVAEGGVEGSADVSEAGDAGEAGATDAVESGMDSSMEAGPPWSNCCALNGGPVICGCDGEQLAGSSGIYADNIDGGAPWACSINSPPSTVFVCVIGAVCWSNNPPNPPIYGTCQ